MVAVADRVQAALAEAAESVVAADAGRGFQERWLEDAVIAALERELPEARMVPRRRPPGFVVPRWDPQPSAFDVTVLRREEPWCLLELKVDDVHHAIWDIVKLACASTLQGVELACAAVAAKLSRWNGRSEGVSLFERPAAADDRARTWPGDFVMREYARTWNRMFQEVSGRPVEVPELIGLTWLGSSPVPAFPGYELRVIAVDAPGQNWLRYGGVG